MKLHKLIFLVLAILLIAQTSCGPQETKDNRIIIATSANMQYAFAKLSQKFTEISGIECQAVVSSSGKLAAQIKAGAPYDAFLSADMKFPNELYEQEFSSGPPQVYALGRMVLWSTIPEFYPGIDSLSSDQVKHIAIANPVTAPYGKAATEVLEHYKLTDSISKKIVFGESIAQVNQFILSRSVEAGFTSMSTVLDSRMKNKGNWTEIEQHLFSPIEQGFVIIQQEHGDYSLINKFRDFLFSETAREILTEYGYLVNE